MKLISNNDLTIDDKIKSYLFLHGIKEEVYIPEHEKEIVLMILTTAEIHEIYVKDGELIIEASQEDE